MKSAVFIPFIRSWNTSHTINFFHTPYTSQTIYLTKRAKGYYSCETHFDTFKEAYEDFKEELTLDSTESMHIGYYPELHSVYCSTIRTCTYK